MNRLLGMLAVAAIAAATPAYAQIKIATVGPMTGQYAAFGEQMKRGAEMAVKDINAAGGVNGQQLVLQVGDKAPEFKLPTTGGSELTLADALQKHKALVFLFYVLDFTGG